MEKFKPEEPFRGMPGICLNLTQIFQTMFDSTSSVEQQLLDLPELPILLERINVRLAGEKKSRVEFREWLTPDIKAEFINGEIVMHSPVAEDHNEIVMHLSGAANFYSTVKKIGKVRVEKALVGMKRNDYEPDVSFWRKEVADTFTPDMNVYPLPDLVVEVLSPGKENIRRDRETKFSDYAAHGIPEYWIIDPKKQTVEQYLLSGTAPNTYELYKKATLVDRIESTAMKGFNIPVRAIFEAEANSEAVQQILREAEE